MTPLRFELYILILTAEVRPAAALAGGAGGGRGPLARPGEPGQRPPAASGRRPGARVCHARRGRAHRRAPPSSEGALAARALAGLALRGRRGFRGRQLSS